MRTPRDVGSVASEAGNRHFDASQALFALLLVTFGLFAEARTIEGRIVGVADGDTVTVVDSSNMQHKVRLSGIDAPEKAQAFGNRSKQSLSELAFNKSATVESKKKDRYGRNVGKVLIDGKDVNLIQIERGMAWFYRVYQAEQSVEDQAAYAAAESKAQAAKLGLWRDAAPKAPWDFRHQKRTAAPVQ
jgi:endonuclease YncB( thermonuclease family)